MPAHKRLTDEQIDALMLEFRAKRLRLRDFAVEKSIPIPTFRRWFKEWEVWQRDARLARLPEKPLAWMPPHNLAGHKEDPLTKDPFLTLMVDLADNLGAHTEQAQHITLCCGGLVVTGTLIGGLEYFAGMQDFLLLGASELPEKYLNEAHETLDKLQPDTERLPERREDWDDYFGPDDSFGASEFIRLASATVLGNWPPRLASERGN